MGKLLALFELLRVGNAVSDPHKWAKGQITVNALVPVILAAGDLANRCGIYMPLSETTAISLAGGVLALVNIVLAVVQHQGLGVGRARPDAGNGGGVDEAPAAAPASRSDEGADGARGDSRQLPVDRQTDSGGTGGVEVRPTDPFAEHGS